MPKLAGKHFSMVLIRSFFSSSHCQKIKLEIEYGRHDCTLLVLLFFPLLCPSITVLWYTCTLNVIEIICFLGTIFTGFLWLPKHILESCRSNYVEIILDQWSEMRKPDKSFCQFCISLFKGGQTDIMFPHFSYQTPLVTSFALLVTSHLTSFIFTSKMSLASQLRRGMILI